MKRYCIRKPQILAGMDAAGFKPTVVLTLLIGLAIFLTYLRVSVVGGLVYIAYLLMNAGWPDLIVEMATSQGVIIFSLFSSGMLILLTILTMRLFEKRPLSTLGLSPGKLVPRYVVGFALGTALILLIQAPVMASEEITYIGIPWLAALYLPAFMVQSASEEIFFRGYLIPPLVNRIGVVWAVVITSALFALAHLPNGDLALLDGINLFIVGALLALYTLRTGSLWGACGIHAAWNFTIGLITPVGIASFPINYAAFTAAEPLPALETGIVGDPYMLVFTLVFLAAIALVLFAGKNRLVVRRPQNPEDTAE